MNTIPKASIRSNERHAGIDVGKSMLDVYIYETNLHWKAANTSEGIRSLVRRLKRYKLTRVLVEAIGGYERAIVEACAEADLPILVITPLRIRQFAKAEGILAIAGKTKNTRRKGSNAHRTLHGHDVRNTTQSRHA